MSRWLIIFGVLLIVAGLLWPMLQKLGLGRLPGDIPLLLSDRDIAHPQRGPVGDLVDSEPMRRGNKISSPPRAAPPSFG